MWIELTSISPILRIYSKRSLDFKEIKAVRGDISSNLEINFNKELSNLISIS